MLHRFFLRFGSDDLHIPCGLGLQLAAHFLRLGFHLTFLDLLFFELQGVAHFFCGQFFCNQSFHAAAVIRRQIDLAHLHAAQHQALLRQFDFEFGFNRLLNLNAFARENLAHGVARKGFVGHALHCWINQFVAHILLCAAGHADHFAGINGIAHHQINT